MSSSDSSRTLFLTGMMGCGKTTLGREIACVLGWEFVDLDKYIESKTGRSVGELFYEFGESRFRELEWATLREMERTNFSRVVALGGGTVLHEEARKHILSMGPVILIDVEEMGLVNRLWPKREGRPLISDCRSRHELLLRIEAIARARKEVYSQFVNRRYMSLPLIPSDWDFIYEVLER